METTIFAGILLIAMGAFSSGSFAVPFGKILNWKWETYWTVFSLGAYILFPLLACFLLSPEFIPAIRAVPSGQLITVFLLGALYGVGNLSFGLALRYLGLSLGYALSLGLMLAIGTLIPPLLDGRLQQMLSGSGGILLIGGVVVACLGIALSAWSGIGEAGASQKSVTFWMSRTSRSARSRPKPLRTHTRMTTRSFALSGNEYAGTCHPCIVSSFETS